MATIEEPGSGAPPSPLPPLPSAADTGLDDPIAAEDAASEADLHNTKHADDTRLVYARAAGWFGFSIIVLTALCSLLTFGQTVDDVIPASGRANEEIVRTVLVTRGLGLLTLFLVGYGLLRFAERMTKPLWVELRLARNGIAQRDEISVMERLADALVRASERIRPKSIRIGS